MSWVETSPEEWSLTTLSQLGEVNRGRSRHRPRYAEHLYGGPYPFIQTGDVKASGGLISSYSQTYSDEGLAQSRLWPAGTMCITIAANIAETGILQFPACFPDSIVGFMANPQVANVRFIEFTFRVLKAQLQQQASGSVQDNINLETLSRLQFRLPPLPKQQAIAEVLGALDDKIAANTKLAATADEYIRARLADLTDDANDVITIQKLATNRKDLTDPNSLDPDANYVGLEHIPRRSMWLDSIGSANSVTSTKAGFQKGDVLFGKLRPYFHKVVSAPFQGICSTDILVLKPLQENLAEFVLASVASDYVVERVTAASEGTRMPRTSWKDLSAVEVAWPGEETAHQFSVAVSALRQSVEGLIRENSILAATRDALLPQLMSGKLRVKDAEALVSAAV